MDEPPPGLRRCTRCKKAMPFDCFSPRPSRPCGWSSWCRGCHKVYNSRWRRSERGRACRRAYDARPDRRQRRRAEDRLRSRGPARKSQQAQYRATLRARLLRGRRVARFRLARADDPKRRAALRKLIKGYDREIARLDRKKKGEAA